MKFDFIIGNPPYQDDSVGDQKNFASPVYNIFMDAVYQIADKVELIHPARFLFNAGATPTEWNKKILNDPHFKILYYEQDSSKIFPHTDIKGGIVVSYHDSNKNFGGIKIFTPYSELNSILNKVTNFKTFKPISHIIHNRGLYRFSDYIYNTYPEEMKVFSDSRIGASSFQRLPKLFIEETPIDDEKYILFLGLLNAKRVYRWFNTKFFNPVKNLYNYKVLIPAASGAGVFGEILTAPLIGEPKIAHTETFLSVGDFVTKNEAESCLKYIKSKLCRAMLGILKITQHLSSEKWEYVPLQDFTSNSDIDWSKSIPEIDRQLYAKYSLDEKEIEFIETHVKEME